ncbi:hypothetical protein EYF80_051819 [Liparis tanakae]|uniref:Uncharacterized protein n=1 Tax=Liparis tanakae TaxID=230148 RepID=A0A4Z2FB28_9TELE|nr:hypothetical protein EYF80_051819 [Liparis tanakae]
MICLFLLAVRKRRGLSLQAENSAALTRLPPSSDERLKYTETNVQDKGRGAGGDRQTSGATWTLMRPRGAGARPHAPCSCSN